jgi:hypothetical protein
MILKYVFIKKINLINFEVLNEEIHIFTHSNYNMSRQRIVFIIEEQYLAKILLSNETEKKTKNFS